MKLKLYIIAAAAAMSLAQSGYARTATRPAKQNPAPPYSFLPQGAPTVKKAVSQLEKDPLLRARYANHYRQPQETVVKFVKTQLVESVIPETRNYTVWYAHKNGKKYAKVKTIRKGTKVLATRDGKPFLHSACGNAFTFSLSWPPKPKPPVKKIRQAQVAPMEQVRRKTVNIVTPFEPATGFLSEAPYELALSTPMADVPYSVLRSRGIIVPFWYHKSHPGIPEPSSLAFLAVASLPLMLLRRRV